MVRKRALEVKKKKEKKLLKKKGIVGVGVGSPAVNVYVENPKVKVPKKINKVKTRKIVTGKIKALPMMKPLASRDPKRTKRWRPLLPGISIGHYKVTAGTLGLITKEGMILSNNHVLAASSSNVKKTASKGDRILQPGPFDGGTKKDKVGELVKWVDLDAKGSSVVDAAVAKPTVKISKKVSDVGTPTGATKAEEGDIVMKSGRTTGLTKGKVLDTNATITVDYGKFSVTFKDQIVTEAMAKGGDSGSALLKNKKVCGLLFAGSNSVTIHNKISNVTEKLGVKPGKFVVTYAPAILPLALGFGTYFLTKR